jgi:large subunit ribosomal protein L10
VNRTEKEQQVESLRRQLEGVQSAFLLGYRGLTVNQVNELRSKIRKTSSSYRVLKNRLASRAFAATALEPLQGQLKGPLALAYRPGEPVVLAKVLTEFAKDNPALELKGGLLDGRPMSAGEVSQIAALPSREVLVAQFAGMLTSPLSAFQRLLLAPMRELAVVLDQLAQKKQSG